MKKAILILSIFTLVLFSCLFVSAESAPMTHTYLTEITDAGEYVFEVVIPPSAELNKIRSRAVLAMYDSKNALCGLYVAAANDYIYCTSNDLYKPAKSKTIKVTPWNKPETIKLMLWGTNVNKLAPNFQYELVSDAVCNENFGNIANINYTKTEDGNYTFETVFKSTVNATYTPVIKMYDASGKIVHYSRLKPISLVAGQPVLKELTVNSADSPARIIFTLESENGIEQYAEIPVTTSTEKYGVIMGADKENGIKLFATDGTYTYYDFADNFVLSYGNTVVNDKSVAYNYLNTLRLTSYNRYCDGYPDERTSTFTPQHDWLLFFNISGDNARYIEYIPTSGRYYFMNASANASGAKDSNIYKYSHFLNNYSKRMVRVLISPDGKITSMALADDNLFKSVISGKALNNVFYDSNTQLINNSLSVKNDAAVIYLPTLSKSTESDFKATGTSWLNAYDDYILKSFTLPDNKQILLITYKFSDTLTAQELANYNADVIKNINYTLYGVNGTQENPTSGINNAYISVSIPPDTNNPNNDYIINVANGEANKAVGIILKNVISGLKKALEGAENGALLNPAYIQTSCATEIRNAREQKNILDNFDANYGTDYFFRLLDKLGGVVPSEAQTFLTEYFL